MMAFDLKLVTIPTRYSKRLDVYVHGQDKERVGKAMVLTVHDVGFNHHSFMPFVELPAMSEVAKKSIWLHVCLPGQDDNAPTIPDDYHFPDLDQLAHDLVFVLDYFNVKTVIGFGEGAGANILCRMAMYHPNRCMGLVLIDCTSATAKVDEILRNAFFNWKEGGAKLVEKVLVHVSHHKSDSKRRQETGGISPLNIGKFLDAYIKRSDISRLIATELKTESLLVNGSRAPGVSSTYGFNRLNASCTTIVLFDGIADALSEAPWNLARALILFCKGCGLLLGIPMLGLEKEFQVLKDRMDGRETQEQRQRQRALARQLLQNDRCFCAVEQ